VRVALAQLDARLGEIDANVGRAGELVHRAARDGADLIVLPECALSGYAVALAEAETAVPSGDPRLGELSSRARGTALVVGFHELAADGRRHSSMAWLEEGAVIGLHRKVLLAGGRWDEARSFAPGHDVAGFDTSLGRAGMLVCNDAWHPALPWLAARDGAELLVVSAASADPLPDERLDIAATWDDLLVGLARLLQVVVVFVNRAGDEAGLRYWGGSRVIDPWGRELARAGREEGVTVVDVDPAAVAAARAEYDVGGDGRLDVVASAVARLMRRD
jgi:predicted amidohydrolase